MTDHPAIEATGLTKTYGPTTVLGGVDVRVAPGSVFSLLGPNGAGKTTLVRILSTLLRPDGGQARVAGFDIIRDRHRVRHAPRSVRPHPGRVHPDAGRVGRRLPAVRRPRQNAAEPTRRRCVTGVRARP